LLLVINSNLGTQTLDTCTQKFNSGIIILLIFFQQCTDPFASNVVHHARPRNQTSLAYPTEQGI